MLSYRLSSQQAKISPQAHGVSSALSESKAPMVLVLAHDALGVAPKFQLPLIAPSARCL
jgi:hypothetical protein